MCAEEISPLTLLQVGVAVHEVAVVAGWLAIVSTGWLASYSQHRVGHCLAFFAQNRLRKHLVGALFLAYCSLGRGEVGSIHCG